MEPEAASIQAPPNISFRVIYDRQHDVPGSRLKNPDKPFLNTSRQFSMYHLKKWIATKMSIRFEPDKLQITCHGQVLKNTDTLTKICETIWKNDEEDLVLHFFAVQQTTKIRVNSKKKKRPRNRYRQNAEQ
jgi:hypothetical protein